MDSARRVAVIIPARLESTRLPRKLLAPLAGKTVLEWAWSRAMAARGIAGVWVATDSEQIASVALAFGAAVLRTGDQPSGSDRVGAALRQLEPQPDAVINLQGDEVLLEPEAITQVAAALAVWPGEIVTCGAPLPSQADWEDPGVVKVVVTASGRALYFSRAAVPGVPRGVAQAAWSRGLVLQHLGIYGYPVAVLARFLELPPTALEQVESLEQLRALEAGIPIRVMRLAQARPAVDTPADLERVRRLLAAESEAACAGDPPGEREGST